MVLQTVATSDLGIIAYICSSHKTYLALHRVPESNATSIIIVGTEAKQHPFKRKP